MPKLRNDMDMGADCLPPVHTRRELEMSVLSSGAIHDDGIAEKDQLVCLRRSAHHVHFGCFRHRSVRISRLILRFLFSNPGHLPILYRIDRRTRADVVMAKSESISGSSVGCAQQMKILFWTPLEACAKLTDNHL